MPGLTAGSLPTSVTPRDLELERSGWFDGSPPCPVKLTLTLYQVAASPTEMPGYFAVALNHTLSASVPSMAPAPFSPTPSGRFRMAVTYYTEVGTGVGGPPQPRSCQRRRRRTRHHPNHSAPLC